MSDENNMKTKDIIKLQLQEYDRLYKGQDDFYCRAAQRSGLSDAAYWVLYRLAGDERDLIQSDLCKEGYFSKQTLNSAVAKLTATGYIELKNVSGGGNRKLLILTDSGQEFCKKHVEPILTAERKAFENMTDEERETMLRLMKKQLDNMNREVEKLWQQ